MGNLVIPLGEKYFSVKVYKQGDCKKFRFKVLTIYFYKKPMGMGKADYDTPDKEWTYPPPNSSIEIILKEVCKIAN